MSEGSVRPQFEARLYFLELHDLHTVAPSGGVH
jgi:hypothetical protein